MFITINALKSAPLTADIKEPVYWSPNDMIMINPQIQ